MKASSVVAMLAIIGWAGADPAAAKTQALKSATESWDYATCRAIETPAAKKLKQGSPALDALSLVHQDAGYLKADVAVTVDSEHFTRKGVSFTLMMRGRKFTAGFDLQDPVFDKNGVRRWMRFFERTSDFHGQGLRQFVYEEHDRQGRPPLKIVTLATLNTPNIKPLLDKTIGNLFSRAKMEAVQHNSLFRFSSEGDFVELELSAINEATFRDQYVVRQYTVYGACGKGFGFDSELELKGGQPAARDANPASGPVTKIDFRHYVPFLKKS